MRNSWQMETNSSLLSYNENVNPKKSGGVTTSFREINSPRALWSVNARESLGFLRA